MMSGNAARRRIIRIVIADDQSIHRQGHSALLHLLCPPLHCLRELLRCKLFPFDHGKSLLGKKIHPLSPGHHRLLPIHQRKGIKMHSPLLYLERILQGQRSGRQVPGIGIFFIIILYGGIDHLKIRIGNQRLPPDHHMSLVLNLKGKSGYGILQIGNIGSRYPVTPCKDLGKLPSVIGKHQGQSIQLPGKPDRKLSCPFYQFLHLLCFCKGKRREFMGLPLSALLGCSGILSGAFRQNIACLCFQPGRLIKHSVPFIITDQFFFSVIICLRSLIQLFDKFLISFPFIIQFSASILQVFRHKFVFILHAVIT